MARLNRSVATTTRLEEMLKDAATLRRTVEAGDNSVPAGTPTSPFLLVLSGLPGTGKTHFARALASRGSFLVLESDRLRKALAPRPKYTPGESSRLFAACHRLVEEYLAEGQRVIFDSTNLTQAHRQPLYHITDRLKVTLILVRFTASREVVRRRLAERASGPHANDYSDANWLVYYRMLPTEEPIARKHFTVGSDEDASAVLERVLRLAEAQG